MQVQQVQQVRRARSVARPARIAPPPVPSQQLELPEPPRIDNDQTPAQGLPMLMMPFVGGTSALLIAVTNIGRPLYVALGLVFFLASVGFGIVLFTTQWLGPRRRIALQRQRYLLFLEEVRERLSSAAVAQRRAATWSDPDPAALLGMARSAQRRYERRPTDPDFLHARLGVGTVDLETRLAPAPDQPQLHVYDAICRAAANDLRGQPSQLTDMPVVADLSGSVTTIIGDRYEVRDLARSLTGQVAVAHSPNEVQIGVVRGEASSPEWEWVKWLPHLWAPEDGTRRLPDSLGQLPQLMGGLIEQRLKVLRAHREGRAEPVPARLILVVDTFDLPPYPGSGLTGSPVPLADLGIHVVFLFSDRRDEPETVDRRITVTNGHATVEEPDGEIREFHPDRLRADAAELLARQLAATSGLAESVSGTGLEELAVPALLGFDPTSFDPEQVWDARPTGVEDELTVPFGTGANGEVAYLDLKESALGGMGPHGLIIGATGSGKSELLRTLVVGLAARHRPETLAMVLADYKGGATFAGLSALPHLAGMLTNLESDAALVDRFAEALYGEISRRQELLSLAGGLTKLSEYQDARRTRPELPVLPSLLIVIDEFSELLTAQPDFADLFLAIGRVGRSLGMHLMLATQRLEIGRSHGLDTHLSYRICLRTFSENESREAIGTADAYKLPATPGAGYLRVDTRIYQRFQAGHLSAPFHRPRARSPEDGHAIQPFTTTAAPEPIQALASPAPDAQHQNRRQNGHEIAHSGALQAAPAAGATTLELVAAAMARVKADT